MSITYHNALHITIPNSVRMSNMDAIGSKLKCWYVRASEAVIQYTIQRERERERERDDQLSGERLAVHV